MPRDFVVRYRGAADSDGYPSSLPVTPQAMAREAPAAPAATTSCVMLIGVLAVLFVFYAIFHRPPKSGEGMRGPKGGKGRSEPPPPDRHIKLDPELAAAAFAAQLVNLTPCTDDACENYQSLAPEVMHVHAKRVVEFVQKTPRFMLMVYAPWCQYCEMFMPNFAQAAKEAKIPFALLNIEMVPRDLFQQSNGFFAIQGFPTFALCRHKEDKKIEWVLLTTRPETSAILELSMSTA